MAEYCGRRRRFGTMLEVESHLKECCCVSKFIRMLCRIWKHNIPTFGPELFNEKNHWLDVKNQRREELTALYDAAFKATANAKILGQELFPNSGTNYLIYNDSEAYDICERICNKTEEPWWY